MVARWFALVHTYQLFSRAEAYIIQVHLASSTESGDHVSGDDGTATALFRHTSPP